MRKKSVVIIGANGQLGSDLFRVFSFDPDFKIIPLTRKIIDITNFKETISLLKKLEPDFVINTAAYHNVDEAENLAEKAFLINALVQQNLAQASLDYKWVNIFISTDYVFGLQKNRSEEYLETDTPGPVNVYGNSKLAGEYFIRYYNPKHFIIRVCGLFGRVGSSGKGGNFVETMIRLAKEKGEVSVVNDQVVSPTYTSNIAQNLAMLIKTNEYGLYHMTSHGHCSWWEFASEIFKLLNLKVKCHKVSSSHFKYIARRPNFSALNNKNLKRINLDLMNHWKKNLKLYLLEKGYL